MIVISNSCTSELSGVFTFEITSWEATLIETYGFKIHPNPAVDDLQISFKRLPKDKLNFTLRASHGAVIQHIQSEGQTNQAWNADFDLDNLAKGVYLLEVKTAKGTFTKKIIKQ